MIHAHVKGQGQRSLGSRVDGRTNEAIALRPVLTRSINIWHVTFLLVQWRWKIIQCEVYRYQLIEVLPVVLSHEPECTEHGPREVVKVGVPVVWVDARLATHVAAWTRVMFLVQFSPATSHYLTILLTHSLSLQNILCSLSIIVRRAAKMYTITCQEKKVFQHRAVQYWRYCTYTALDIVESLPTALAHPLSLYCVHAHCQSSCAGFQFSR